MRQQDIGILHQRDQRNDDQIKHQLHALPVRPAGGVGIVRRKTHAPEDSSAHDVVDLARADNSRFAEFHQQQRD